MSSTRCLLLKAETGLQSHGLAWGMQNTTTNILSTVSPVGSEKFAVEDAGSCRAHRCRSWLVVQKLYFFRGTSSTQWVVKKAIVRTRGVYVLSACIHLLRPHVVTVKEGHKQAWNDMRPHHPSARSSPLAVSGGPTASAPHRTQQQQQQQRKDC